MATALEHDFAALPHEDARPGVHSFSRGWVAALVLCDVGLFLAATYLAGVFVKNFWLSSVAIRHVAVPASLTALLSVLVFWQLGLYQRSFAMSVRDEFYHAVAALSLASAPVLIVFSTLPADLDVARRRDLRRCSSRSRWSARRGPSRTAFATPSILAHPRRIAVVGHPSRLEFAEDAMRTLPNARVFRIAVPNIDAVGALTPGGRRRAAVVPRRGRRGAATRWSSPRSSRPSMMPHVLAAGERIGMTIAFAPPRIRVHAYDLRWSRSESRR